MSERNDGDGTDHYDVKAEPNSVPTNVTFTVCILVVGTL